MNVKNRPSQLTLNLFKRVALDPALFKVELVSTKGDAILLPINELARDALGGTYSTTKSMVDTPTVRSKLRLYCASPCMGVRGVLFRV